MSSLRRQFGISGEDAAIQHLLENGYRIVQRNFSTRIGEIDIIAEDGKVLVFVEVKARKNSHFGSPFEAVTPKKQKKISMVALEYMSKNGLADVEARFDVIGISQTRNGNLHIELLKNCFDVCYG